MEVDQDSAKNRINPKSKPKCQKRLKTEPYKTESKTKLNNIKLKWKPIIGSSNMLEEKQKNLKDSITKNKKYVYYINL